MNYFKFFLHSTKNYNHDLLCNKVAEEFSVSLPRTWKNWRASNSCENWNVSIWIDANFNSVPIRLLDKNITLYRLFVLRNCRTAVSSHTRWRNGKIASSPTIRPLGQCGRFENFAPFVRFQVIRAVRKLLSWLVLDVRTSATVCLRKYWVVSNSVNVELLRKPGTTDNLASGDA